MSKAHNGLPRTILAVCAVLLMVGSAGAQIVPVPNTPEQVTINVPFTGTQAVYAEDFNADDGLWDAVTDVPPRSSWEWGAPTSGPGQAASGSNVWGTRLHGDYYNSECGALLSPPLTVPAGSSASVSFKEWRHMEQGTTIAWDAGLLFTSTDGGATYTKVTPDIGYTSPGISTSVRACLFGQATGTAGLSGPVGTTPPAPAYTDISVDLSPLAGSTVQLAIAFGTDSVVTRAGWYIDDFVFTVDGVPAETYDFESDDGGFSVVEWNAAGAEPKGWSWGVPTTGPDAGPGAFSMWATDPAGNHGNNECSSIESAPVDLSLVAGTNAVLEWRQWFHGNFGAGGVVQVGDGSGYTNLVPTTGYGATNPSTALDPCLEHVSQASRGFAGKIDALGAPLRGYAADLSAWIGQTVTVRFLFASTATVTALPGWYVDDVRIVAGVGGQSQVVELPSAPGSDDARAFVPALTAYAEDFNFDGGGWTETGTGAWQHGDTESPPTLMPGSIQLWGTRPLGDYAANECSTLTSVPVALPAANAGDGITLARLSFNLWRYTHNLFDGAHLQASSDGGTTWQRLTPDQGYDAPLSTSSSATPVKDCLGVGSDPVWTGPSSAPAEDEWQNVTVDLTQFMGQEVLLRFVFGSGASTERRGVYIDNVVVHVGAGSSTAAADQCNVLPGWDVTGTNPSWCFSVPTSGPASQRPVWATQLHGQHNRAECSAIVSDPIDTNLVAGLGTLTLQFTHYFRASSTVGGGLVQVTRDGGATWNTVTPVGGYPASLGTTPRACLAPGASSQAGFTGNTMGAYDTREVRLGSYQGDTIQVRFAFGSGTGTPDLGWYLRGITLSRGAAGLPLTPASLEVVEIPDSLAEKADPALVRAILGGQTQGLEMMVTGRPHEPLSANDFSNRADAMSHLDAVAAPFFERMRDIALQHGAEVVGEWSAGPAIKIVGDLDTATALSEDEMARSLAEDGPDKVQLIEPEESDTLTPENTEGRNMIQAEDIWAAGFRGDGVKIAVIDTGVDARHEAFKNADGSTRIAKWANCITSTSTCDTTGTPFDDHGHGTHVSGTAAGNNLYVDPDFGAFTQVGVAPNATLYGVKFLSGSGGGSFGDAIKALQWSFDNGADLTSNSWGGSCSASSSVVQVVNTLTGLGMLSVFAAGNSGGTSTIGGPACADTSLSVGAVDRNKNIAAFSSRGPCADPTTGTGSRICPDVVAKGVDVCSAIPRSGAAQGDPSGYKCWQGTSMATPHVAGAVALIEEMKRFYTGVGWDTSNEAEKEVLKMTALDLGEPGPDNTYGWGLVQLLPVYVLLNSMDEANIVSTFGISNGVLRLGDATTLSFGVRNLGGATATGDFVATLTHPDGNVQTLETSSVSLSLLDGKSTGHVFTVSGNVATGTYTFAGTFDYTWVDPNTNETVTGSVSHSGTFEVKRVFMSFDVQGLAPSAGLLLPQEVTVTATNTGNEDARNVVVEFTVPKSYLFLTPGRSDPAPDRVHDDPNFNRMTLIFEVGDLPEGASFTFTTELAPTQLGTYTFISAAKFEDGAGRGFSQGNVYRQTVNVV